MTEEAGRERKPLRITKYYTLFPPGLWLFIVAERALSYDLILREALREAGQGVILP